MFVFELFSVSELMDTRCDMCTGKWNLL